MDANSSGAADYSTESGRHGGTTLTDAIRQWPSPTANQFEGSTEAMEARRARIKEKGINGNGFGLTTAFAAQAWPTPNVPNGGRSSSTSNHREDGSKQQIDLGALAGQWCTPKTLSGGANSKRDERGAGGPDLQEQVQSWPTPTMTDSEMAGSPNAAHLTLDRATKTWPSPNARDHKGEDLTSRRGGASLSHFAEKGERSHCSLPDQPTNGGPPSSESAPGSRRRLNPAFTCWLMGLPPWWTHPDVISFGPSEMAEYRSWLRSHLASLLDGVSDDR